MDETKTTETVNQENNTAEQPERTFTQSEMNAIMGERLAREHAKYADYDDLKAKAAKYDEQEEASKSELQKALEKADALQRQVDQMEKANEVRQIRDKVSAETGVPASMLYGDDEVTCKAQAQKIMEFAGKKIFPQVPDGGEVAHVPGGKTRDKFAEWFDDQMKK